MLVEITFLRESHVALFALEGALTGMGPQVIEIFAHGGNTKRASLVVRGLVLALEQLEEARLRVWPKEVVDEVVLTLW